MKTYICLLPLLAIVAILAPSVVTANAGDSDRKIMRNTDVVDSGDIESAVMEVVVTVSDPIGVFTNRSALSLPQRTNDPMAIGGYSLDGGIPSGSVDPTRMFDRTSGRAVRVLVVGSEGDAIVLRMAGMHRNAQGPTVMCRRRPAESAAASDVATTFDVPQTGSIDMVPVELTYAVGTPRVGALDIDSPPQVARRFTTSGETHELRIVPDGGVMGNSVAELWIGGVSTAWSTVGSGVYQAEIVLMVALSQ